jgi:hypothetical protein
MMERRYIEKEESLAPAKRIKDLHHDIKRGEQLSPEKDYALAC